MKEKLTAVVNRITYQNPNNGWSVMRVEPLSGFGQETVTIYQAQIFAGATMEFIGEWQNNPKYGRQFKAEQAIEKKPASLATLEKYLGSGLIKGVGPKTAKKIVKHFKEDTLEIFDHAIDRLEEVPGISSKKLKSIAKAWDDHRKIRDVMMFLQNYGISTLFSVRIYQTYGDEAIDKVSNNPYCLSDDIYGIGFFSADKVALSMGFDVKSLLRIHAAIKHVLSASREQGHCYLIQSQIVSKVEQLIHLDINHEIEECLKEMLSNNQLKTREVTLDQNIVTAYYARSIYFNETDLASTLNRMNYQLTLDKNRISDWIEKYCEKNKVFLSSEQQDAVLGIVHQGVSILTGGPGCGKTTTTLVIVRLLEAMGCRMTLSAPTGRAAQRMSEVIGRMAKTVHRLLEWKGGEFKVNERNPLDTDFLIIDEASMLDVSLADALTKALPSKCQLLFIGDADQLPSVGAGNVLKDLIASKKIPSFQLTKIFRQSKESYIIKNAHLINQGKIGNILSPFKFPKVWKEGIDCLFIDSDEMTQEQLNFLKRVKQLYISLDAQKEDESEELYHFRCNEEMTSPFEITFEIPKKFEHVPLDELQASKTDAEALKILMKKIHPWSSVHYGLSALETIVKLYMDWIPKYLGNVEIQILSPMTRGSLGTDNLNKVIQDRSNAYDDSKAQIQVGQKILRIGDRVIQKRNDYDLNVFNGDIGKIIDIDPHELSCIVAFYPDNREVIYLKNNLVDLDLAYAITIHKSQGSEFEVVILPIFTQHFKMLYRNLIYTGLTRAKKMSVFVGTRRALVMASKNQDTTLRQTALQDLLENV